MSITLLKKFFKFLSRNLGTFAVYFEGNIPKDYLDELIDKFIDEITPIEQKCKFCKNRLIRIGVFYCPGIGNYILEMYADEEEYGRSRYIFWRKTFSEFEDCEFERCEHVKRKIAQQCRACGAVFFKGGLLKLGNFNQYHAEKLEEDFGYYKNKFMANK